MAFKINFTAEKLENIKDWITQSERRKCFVTIGICTCNAAHPLADCSAQRFEDGRAQSLCHCPYCDSGAGGRVLGVKRLVYCNSSFGGSVECPVAHLPGDYSGIVHLQSYLENRSHGICQEDAGRGFQGQTGISFDYWMGIWKFHGGNGRLWNSSGDSSIHAGGNRA